MKTCANWEPGRGSKYYRCNRFLTSKVTCDLKPSACKECPFYIATLGRPESKIDWNDAEKVKERNRQYMKLYREKNGHK